MQLAYLSMSTPYRSTLVALVGKGRLGCWPPKEKGNGCLNLTEARRIVHSYAALKPRVSIAGIDMDSIWT